MKIIQVSSVKRCMDKRQVAKRVLKLNATFCVYLKFSKENAHSFQTWKILWILQQPEFNKLATFHYIILLSPSKSPKGSKCLLYACENGNDKRESLVGISYEKSQSLQTPQVWKEPPKITSYFRILVQNSLHCWHLSTVRSKSNSINISGSWR